MEDETAYDETAQLVDSIDSSRPGAEASIDIKELFANRIATKKIGYAEADGMLEKVTGTAARVSQPVQQQVQQPRAQPRAQATQREAAGEMAGAAASLKSMVGGVEKEFTEGISRKIEEAKQANLVMPKLSVQDQLSDLDKIKEGIEEGVFGREQMKIIIDELRGMSQIASREDTSAMSADQRELVLMRNQRIKEIKLRLNMR